MGAFRFYKMCNVFRSSPEREADWKHMMSRRRKITVDEFARLCDTQGLVEEDEPLDEFGADDPGSGFYHSQLSDGTPCVFAQTAGFEYIFLREQDALKIDEDPTPAAPRFC